MKLQAVDDMSDDDLLVQYVVNSYGGSHGFTIEEQAARRTMHQEILDRMGDHNRSETEKFFVDALAEVVRARKKYPPESGNPNLAALTEETGELAKALLEQSPGRIYDEAIQVACVAARIATEGDRTLDKYRKEQGL